MKSRGLHFFPQEDAEKYASLSDKVSQIENGYMDVTSPLHLSVIGTHYESLFVAHFLLAVGQRG